MDNNIELKLIGITYNQIESGVYALILEDPIMKRRLAIVIGYPEAQSIECKLQNVRTPRPLAHDLLANMLKALDATLLRVDIKRLPTGPYAGTLKIQNSIGEIIEIDARSSDAIALAIRVNAPIYTNRELLEKEGFIPKTTHQPATVRIKSRPGGPADEFSRLSLQELEERLNKEVAEEHYEKAAEIQREIQKRKGELDPTNQD